MTVWQVSLSSIASSKRNLSSRLSSYNFVFTIHFPPFGISERRISTPVPRLLIPTFCFSVNPMQFYFGTKSTVFRWSQPEMIFCWEMAMPFGFVKWHCYKNSKEYMLFKIVYPYNNYFTSIYSRILQQCHKNHCTSHFSCIYIENGV